MHEKYQNLLNAYLDGELAGRHLRELESHLASCDTCRYDLQELRRVSEILQSTPAPQVIPAERFVSHLALKLPQRILTDRALKPASPAWLLVPAGLIGAWIFIQTVFVLTDALSLVKLTGLLGQASSWLGTRQETFWFSAATGLFGGQAGGSNSWLSVLNNVNVFAADLLSGFFWQAAIVLLYWVWLVFWWVRRNPQPLKMRNVS